MSGRLASVLIVAAVAAGFLQHSVLTGPTSALSARTINGLWMDDEGRGGIEIRPCGDQLCGNIVWLRQPVNPQGRPWADLFNPDESKRARPVCGLQIIGGLKKSSDAEWKGGWIYDPEEGKTFDVELTLTEPDTLQVFGYAGIRIISETLLWQRMPASTARCR